MALLRDASSMDRQLFEHRPLLQAMVGAWGEIDVGAIQGWMAHSMRFFPRCLEVKILPVMWMRHCGWTQLCGKMLPSFLIFMQFFYFSVNFLLIQSTLNSPAYVALIPSVQNNF